MADEISIRAALTVATAADTDGLGAWYFVTEVNELVINDRLQVSPVVDPTEHATRYGNTTDDV